MQTECVKYAVSIGRCIHDVKILCIRGVHLFIMSTVDSGE